MKYHSTFKDIGLVETKFPHPIEVGQHVLAAYKQSKAHDLGTVVYLHPQFTCIVLFDNGKLLDKEVFIVMLKLTDIVQTIN